MISQNNQKRLLCAGLLATFLVLMAAHTMPAFGSRPLSDEERQAIDKDNSQDRENSTTGATTQPVTAPTTGPTTAPASQPTSRPTETTQVQTRINYNISWRIPAIEHKPTTVSDNEPILASSKVDSK